MSKSDHQTHFGFQQVPVGEKAAKVAEVFHSVAQRYDVMNDLMSFGLHRCWKRFATSLCAIRPDHQVLDIAGGTGDLSARLYPALNESGNIYIVDINASMLQAGRERLLDCGMINKIKFIQADAEQLPFAEQLFDRIIIGFGLRNVTNKLNALKAMFAALKPGGRCLILEFSTPSIKFIKPFYDFYSFKILPLLGRWVAQDESAYRYLAESIRMHPSQEELIAMMEQAGFEDCRYINLSTGIVAIHIGYKY